MQISLSHAKDSSELISLIPKMAFNIEHQPEIINLQFCCRLTPNAFFHFFLLFFLLGQTGAAYLEKQKKQKSTDHKTWNRDKISCSMWVSNHNSTESEYILRTIRYEGYYRCYFSFFFFLLHISFKDYSDNMYMIPEDIFAIWY